MYREENYYNTDCITNVSITLMEAAVMRLPQFLADYAAKLDDMAEEYKESSDIAVKMFNAIHSEE